jgi:hypothetical protein
MGGGSHVLGPLLTAPRAGSPADGPAAGPGGPGVCGSSLALRGLERHR